MSDLEHWTSDGATEAEAKLLAAARGGGPSPAARARIAGAIGIGASIASGSLAAGKGSLSLSKWMVGKWLAIAAVGAMTAVAVWHLTRERAPSVALSAPATPTTVARSALPVGVPEPVRAVPDPEPAEARRAPESIPQKPRATAPSGMPSSSVDAELVLLEAAKESLNQHRPDAALATVTDYERLHPRGVLAIEAKVIRIEALVQAGQSEKAKTLANAFLRAFPNAPQAERVRSLVREIDSGP